MDKPLFREKFEHPSVKAGEPHPHSAPPKKPIPDPRLLGAVPVKPSRPPLVDLSRYHPPTVNGMLIWFKFLSLFFFFVFFFFNSASFRFNSPHFVTTGLYLAWTSMPVYYPNCS